MRPAYVAFLSALAVTGIQAQWFVATVPADSSPTMLCHNTQNGYVYCCNWGGDDVTVIDCAGDSVLTTIAVGEEPHAILYNPVNNRVLCFDERSKTMSVIDGATNSVVSTESLYTRPWDAVRGPANDKVYVLGHSPDNVTVVDGATYVIDTVIPFPFPPYGVCYDSTDDRVYVSTRNDSTVWAIDCAANNIIATIKVGPGPNKLCWNSRENKVYTATAVNSDSSVYVIDCATNTVVATLKPGSYPSRVAYDPAESNVWVSNTSSRTLSVIDGAGDTVLADIPTGSSGPQGLCANPNFGHVFCGLRNDTVLVLDATSHSTITRVGIDGRRPHTLLHNPIDGRVYTTDYSSASVSILLDAGTGIAEAQKSRTAHGAAPTIVSRAQLMARLQHNPSLSLFDATGRAIINLQSGVVFLLSPAGPHRLVVAE